MISVMKRVYAESGRTHRHSEDLKGLPTWHGRVMSQPRNTQSFNWVETYPQEVPSTA